MLDNATLNAQRETQRAPGTPGAPTSTGKMLIPGFVGAIAICCIADLNDSPSTTDKIILLKLAKNLT
jgi:hypothetical protein